MDNFIDSMENKDVFLLVDEERETYERIYFFQGRDSILCISKDSNKVLKNILYDGLEIVISGPVGFELRTRVSELTFTVDPLKQNRNQVSSASDSNSLKKKMI